MQSAPRILVVLGTGGTIAGSAASADDNVAYRAATLPVATLVASLPTPAGVVVESEQVAQLDSKDMDFATWRALAGRVAGHLARPEVAAIIVTHGTDTLEETAYFLQRVLAPAKPVVLTAAMRPATSRLADGPQNLADAVAVATRARCARRRRRRRRHRPLGARRPQGPPVSPRRLRLGRRRTDRARRGRPPAVAQALAGWRARGSASIACRATHRRGRGSPS